MSCECQVHDGRLMISGDLTIYAAPEVKERVLTELKHRQRAPTIDLSEVTEIDTAGVQVLVLAQRLCEASGGRFAVLNPSAAAREALALCGLNKWIAEAPASETAS